jgi:hypothetical protein
MDDEVTSRLEDLEARPVLLLQSGPELVAGVRLDRLVRSRQVLSIGGGDEVMPHIATFKEYRPLGVLLEQVAGDRQFGAVL